MLQQIKGEQPFQVLNNAFSISPSNEGYQLQISSDGFNYTTLFSVGPNVTRLVTGVAAGSYYRLLGNNSDVVINWRKSCSGGEGGGGEYILPVATADVLGGVKIGSGITIDSEGHISAQGGGSGDMDKLVPVSELPESAADGTVLALAESAGTEYGVYQAQGVAPDYNWVNYDGSTTGWTMFRTNFCDFNYNSVFEYADENGVEICKFTVNWTSDQVGIYNVQGDYACTVTKNADNDYTVVADGEPSSAHVYVEDGYGYIMLNNMYFLTDVWGDGVRSAQIGTENPHGGETNWVKIGEMPVASETVLGGIKVGSGLAIAADGTLSASGSSYELPPATQSTLGGVKVGSGLSVAADGTLSANGGGGSMDRLSPSSAVPASATEETVFSLDADNKPFIGDGVNVLTIALGQLQSRLPAWQKLFFSYANDNDALTLQMDNGVVAMDSGSGSLIPITSITEGRWARLYDTVYVYRDANVFAAADTANDITKMKDMGLHEITPVVPKSKGAKIIGGYGDNGSWVSIDLNGHGMYDKDITAVQRFYQISGLVSTPYGFNFTMENGKSIDFVWDNTEQVFIVGSQSGATLDIAETATAPEFYGVVEGNYWFAMFICGDESVVAQFSQIDGYAGFENIDVRLNTVGVKNLVQSSYVSKIWRGTQAEYDLLSPSDDTIYIILSE